MARPSVHPKHRINKQTIVLAVATFVPILARDQILNGSTVHRSVRVELRLPPLVAILNRIAEFPRIPCRMSTGPRAFPGKGLPRT